MVEISSYIPPGKLHLLRSVNDVQPDPIIAHLIALEKLYISRL